MDFINELNSEQQDAVTTVNRPLLVLAGAGSGKTRVVTYRIIYLLQQGVPPSKILGLTFTNKAAQEMQERVLSMTQSNVLISTFHSLGARLLREAIQVLGYRRDFTIYDEDDANKLLLTCMDGAKASESKALLKAVRHYISQAKNGMLELDSEDNEVCYRFYEKYQEKLKEYNAVDFDDLLYLPVKILKEFPTIREYYQQRWTHLLIDEYQDTNNAQYEFVKCLLSPCSQLCVVGDPDQSIYSWRGANIKNILQFEKDYLDAKVILLEQNYRSRSNILEAANALIAANANRYEKKLWSGRGEGESIKYFTAYNEHEEAEFVGEYLKKLHNKGVPWNQMVIFYRTHALSRSFEDVFYLKRIPYMIMGGVSFYQRKEIKDILAYLRMVVSGSDFIAFSRTINLPKRGVGGASLEKLRLGAIRERLPIYDYCMALLENKPLQQAPLRLTGKLKEGLMQFMRILHSLRILQAESSLPKLVQAVINLTDYMGYLREDMESYEERKENLNSLVAKATEWYSSAEDPSLMAFLEELSLKSALDEEEGNPDRVHLMTIHNGKGLEYDTVFLVGLEEELFPHSRSLENTNELEEERRLCYVGMTRAKERLYLSNVAERFLWGSFQHRLPSRFLKEIPSKYVDRIKFYK